MLQLKRLPLQVRFNLVTIGFISLLALKVWLLNSTFDSVRQQENWVRHTAEVMNTLDLAMSAAKDAETGIRGYLLTSREEFLEPYRMGVQDTLEHISRVKRLTIDNESQQEAITAIEELAQKRFALLKQMLALVRARGSANDQTYQMIMEGKSITDNLRLHVDKMKAFESVLLNQRAEKAENSKNLFTAVLYVANIIMALVIAFAFTQIGRNQARVIKETQEKDQEAREKEVVTRLAENVAGDLSLDVASHRVLKFLSDQFGALAAKIYTFEHGRLKPVATLGTDTEHLDSPTAKAPALLRSAFEKTSTWQIQDIPDDYWKISSGLGDHRPKALAFIPFSFQRAKIGVIELGLFEPLSSHDLLQLSNLAETIGVGINAAQARTRLQSLLETTQQQSEELQAQQEELKASNEELEQQARALESQQQALNIKNKELEQIQKQLEIRAADLQRSTQYKSEFLAKMSHELRTPLNGILILSTLLTENKEKNLNDQQKQFAESIHSAGNDLLSLINDILDLSKIEARKLSLNPSAFTLTELFQSMRRTFQPQTDAKSLQLATELPDDLAATSLHTDRQRLDQILRNFLSNAIKFTEIGTITLSANLSLDKKSVRINVHDTGIGIPSQKQKLIFEAFEQADGTVNRKYGGTGLGLTISRELAQLLGGTITVESREGHGSIFSVSIPCDLATPAKMSVLPSISETKARSADIPLTSSLPLSSEESADRINADVQKALQGTDDKQRTILVVEDDDHFRRSIVEAVRAYDFKPIEASDGEVALGILKNHIPSAILLDIKLPGISGLGILEMIKQMPHLRHIPVHMISAMDYQQNALRMGALGYLTKPVTIDKVRSALGRIEKLISNKVRRVLLIEDDERQSMAVSELISGSDIEVVPAPTGAVAVQKLKSDGFDCVILDLTLPDVSGFDLLKQLSELEISLPPIVIYTGKDLSSEEDRYLRQFSESIIIKGARSPERLLDEVNLFLHRVESLLPEATQEILSTLRSQEKSFEGKTVLVVDDDIRNIFALTSALEAKGLKVVVARDGVEAVEAVETNVNIDIVLMDIMMPRMNGFEAMQKIRQSQDRRIKQLPIVALTAKAMREDHEKCIEAGASDYLPKPVNLENLTTILKVWLTPKGLFA